MPFEHPRTSDPDGREVVFDVGSRLHLGERRPWLLDHIDVLLGAVARPDHRALDPIPNRGHTVEYDEHGAVVGLELMGVRRAVESGSELQLTWPPAQVAASALFAAIVA